MSLKIIWTWVFLLFWFIFFLTLVWFFFFFVVLLGFFNPLNLVHKAGLHWISYLPNFCLISKSVQ